MRGRLDHALPHWVDSNAVFFVTMNARSRGVNYFCNEDTSRAIFEAAWHYQNTERWFCEILLLIPDHLHMLVSAPRDKELAGIVGMWKQWLARKHKISWQENFFDHRLRRDESGEEKWQYIYQNPVRARLVEKAEKWRWIWIPGGE
jgi:putative transposase